MKIKMNKRIQRVWASILVAGFASALASAAEEKPNIIIIMADDMGYEGLSCNGSLDYKTPRLDALAAQGLRFKNCHSLPICTPSRVKMMTGQYSFRNYESFGLLPASQVTFAKQLSAVGYRTCMVGKWQLGGTWDSPLKFGFDEYCLLNGILPKEKFDKSSRGKSRYWGYPAVVNNGELYESEHQYGPDMLNEYACDFIKKHRDEPFFLYYPMLLPHSPFEPSPKTQGAQDKDGKTSEVKYFDDMVAYIDVLVGNVLKALEDSGQRENTVIMFTADNGTTYPVNVTASNSEIRRMVAEQGRTGMLYEAGTLSPKPKASGKKSGYKEGPVTRTSYGDVPGGKDLMNDYGTHVPLVVDWPRYASAFKEAGNEVDDLVDFSDFFATVVELAGASLPDGHPGDGVSFAKRLRGEGVSQREFIFCHYWEFGRKAEEARDAIHDAKWKLYNDGSFYHIAEDLAEEVALDLAQLSEVGKAAHQRLTTAYQELRGFGIPNKAPNKVFQETQGASATEGITLSQQIASAKEKAQKNGKTFNLERSTKFFHAKDLNKDGVLDAAEQKAKAPKNWNK